MGRKIIFIVLSLAIAVTGVFAFRRLNYWERSARIFKYKTTESRFEGRRGRPGGEFRGRPDGEFRDRSVGETRQRSEGDFTERPDRSFRDGQQREFRQGPAGDPRDTTERELRQRSDREFRQRSENRATVGPGDLGRGGHGRGDIRGGQQIRLRNVWLFLAVFSGFTVLTIFLDRGWKRMRKKKLRTA